jgi:hypothetical protein
MSDDPPLPFAGLQDDEPPPHKFPELLAWLRGTYTWREYTLQGRAAPSKFNRGYSQRMAATCLKNQGFKRCNQTRLLRMEQGKDWPGKTRPTEKQPFLRAANHCFALQRSPWLRAVLWASLLLQSGEQGFPPDMTDDAFEVVRKWWEGNEQ